MATLPQVYRFEMKRTYTTIFEIPASSEAEARALYEELGDRRYEEELEQMNVEEEVENTLTTINGRSEHFAYLID
jgi:hypothetical protein